MYPWGADVERSVRAVKVWDFPVRLFHWGQALLIGGLWLTAELGEMDWHIWLAYCLGTLWSGRIIWGVIGSDTARFTQFLASPKRVWRYFRGESPSQLGHNPAGGWMVILLLTLVGLQFFSGLCSSDDIFVEGPLYASVSSDFSAAMGWWHEVNFNLLLGAVAIHVLAVLVYEIKGQRLLLPMINGMTQHSGGAEIKIQRQWLWWLLLSILGVGLYLWWQPTLPW
jgi:cytochrome b